MYPASRNLSPDSRARAYTGAERNRPDRVPRVYVYRAGTKPEGDIGTLPHKYSGALDPAINLYDMGKDALGLLKPRQRQTSYGVIHEPVDLSAVERKIKRLGFHGYSNYNPRIPHAIAVFKPVRVKQEV